jgi:hypothetical protein
METLKNSPANRARIARVEAVLGGIFGEVLDHGFHGRASLELTITDGTIQRISRTVERSERIEK